jgi:hypothetical protein
MFARAPTDSVFRSQTPPAMPAKLSPQRAPPGPACVADRPLVPLLSTPRRGDAVTVRYRTLHSSALSGRSSSCPGGRSAKGSRCSGRNGSEMRFSWLNHLPRSTSLQRCEQNGPYLPSNQFPSFLQLGHLMGRTGFIARCSTPRVCFKEWIKMKSKSGGVRAARGGSGRPN